MRVQYIGQKAKKYDNVTLSSYVWTPGQVQEVPDELGKRLISFTLVWKEVHEEIKAEAKAAPVLSGAVKPRPIKE